MSRPATLVLLLLACLAPLEAPGQAVAPFATLEVAASGTLNVNRNTFHETWRRGYGGGLHVATPFYLGTAELGADLHRYDSFVPPRPRFDALFLFAGWGVAADPPGPLDSYVGLRLGNYRMTFDDATFEGVRNESELAVALHGRLGLRLTDELQLFTAATLLQAYTFVRLRFAYASAGVSYRLDTPRWLQSVLE